VRNAADAEHAEQDDGLKRDCLAAAKESEKESVYTTKGDDSVIRMGKVK
jgi:hypothetical protein